MQQYGKYNGYASSRWAYYRWEIRHWWYNHVSGPLFGPYSSWRHEDPEYRAVMTDIGRSFLMREMRLRRLPGALRVQQTYRHINPAQWPGRGWRDISANGVPACQQTLPIILCKRHRTHKRSRT